jgi:hypothetical protein
MPFMFRIRRGLTSIRVTHSISIGYGPLPIVYRVSTIGYRQSAIVKESQHQ